MRKVMAICFLAFLGAGMAFVGCKDGKKTRIFGFNCFLIGTPYYDVLEQTIREEVEKNGDRLITYDPDVDSIKQINQIEDMISQKLDAVFLGPVDLEEIRPALVSLNKARIPVINIESEVKDIDLVTAYVGSDNRNAGYVCGLDMVKRFPKGGPIAVLDAQSRVASRSRIEGFNEAIAGKGFTIVFLKDATGGFPVAQRLTEEMLKSNPEVIAIMTASDPIALDALAACQAANRSNILIYGINGSPEARAAIARGGQFAGTGAQNPISIAKESAAIAYKILNRQAYEKRIIVETFMINQENITEFDINSWQ